VNGTAVHDTSCRAGPTKGPLSGCVAPSSRQQTAVLTSLWCCA
jgi:hypothetical protein